jgi:zinc D-Ala-D-Ala dipeptidase
MCDLLVKLPSALRSHYRRKDTGITDVLVRPALCQMLERVQERLKPYDLLVVEGYRPLAYQERYFLMELHTLFQKRPDLPLDALIEKTNQLVALPSRAGHPTGGAVDLTLCYEGEEVDMGGQIADFSVPELLPTFSPHVAPSQARLRRLLLEAMTAEGFAPFYGEWWHFSYGDIEWAEFYQKDVLYEA